MNAIRYLPPMMLAIAALASGARADQFQALEPEQAERVLDLLRPGTVFGHWQSHRGGAPDLFVLESAQVVDSERYSEVEVVAEPLATLVEDGGELAPVFRDDPSETFRVDAAYLYVPYGDLASLRVNAARLLELRSEFFPDGARVDQLAFEVPASVFARTSRRAEPRPEESRGLSDLVPGVPGDRAEVPADHPPGSAAVPSRLARLLTEFIMRYRRIEAARYYSDGGAERAAADERRAHAFFAEARLVPEDGPGAEFQGSNAFRVVNAAGDPGDVIGGDVWVLAVASARVRSDGAFSGYITHLALEQAGDLWVGERVGRNLETYWIFD